MINYLLSKFIQGGDEHTSKRNTRLLLSITTSVLTKLIGVGSTLITIPLTLNYLGTESFGVWMVISSVVGFMSFSDLGIGMGLQNALSKAYGEEDTSSQKYYVSNAYALAIIVVCVASTTLITISYFVPIERLFKITDQVQLDNAVSAFKYCVLAFFMGIPVALIQRVLGGLQKTYVANNVMLVGSVISLCSIFTSVYLDLGIVGLSLLFVLSPLIAQLIYSIYFFFFKQAVLRPRLRFLSRSHVSSIISTGAWTLCVQIIYTAKMNVPTMIISASLGLLAVSEFSIVQKLTGLLATMVGMALQPLWVVYGEAYYRGDREWIEKTLTRSLQVVLVLTGAAAIAFQYVGQWLITAWIGDGVLPSLALIAGFSLWMITSNINICFVMLLNGTGNFKRQAMYSIFCVGGALLLVAELVEDVGLVGVILIIFLMAELMRLPFNYFETKRIVNHLDKKVD
jgi:O-antigen/teichoic acid export membrane protein